MAPQPVCRITIDLLSDGNIVARGNIPSRMILNSMITTAWQDLLGIFREKESKLEKGEAVLIPPQGFSP